MKTFVYFQADISQNVSYCLSLKTEIYCTLYTWKGIFEDWYSWVMKTDMTARYLSQKTVQWSCLAPVKETKKRQQETYGISY